MRFKKWIVPLSILAAAILLSWVFVFANTTLTKHPLQAGSTLWNVGWQVKAPDGSLSALTLPARLQSKQIEIQHTLPDSIPKDQYLFIKCNYLQISASIDGVPISIIKASSDATPPSLLTIPWSAISLTPDMAGKAIHIGFQGTGSKLFMEVYSSRLGSLSQIQLDLLSSTQLATIFNLLIILFSIFLYAFAFLEARHHHDRLSGRYYYLILFVTLCGVWFYTDSNVSGVYYIGSLPFMLVSLFCYFLQPIPFLSFTFEGLPRFAPIGKRINLLYLANALLQGILLATGYFTLWVALLITNLLTLLAMSTLAYHVLAQRGRGSMRPEMRVGVLATALSSLLSIFLCYLYPIEFNAALLRYGLIILVFSLAISVLRSNVDILMQAESIEQLRIHEEEYRIAVRQSEKSVVRFDVERRALQIGDDSAPLFGPLRVITDLPEYAIEKGLVAEESVADFRKFFYDIIDGVPTGSLSSCLHVRDGSFVWYHADYTTVFSANGKPLQAIISFYDVTEQRERELAYQKWKQTYAEMSSVEMNYYEYNLTRDTFTSEAGSMLPPLPDDSKHSLNQAIDYITDRFVAPVDDTRIRTFFYRDTLLTAFAHGIRSDHIEFRRMDDQGITLWTIASVQLISDPYSNDIHAFLLFKDEDEHKRNELLMHLRSNSDPLTGLLNRTAFEEQLSELISQTDSDTSHALLMIDVDGFKRVNDNFGHQFGDQVLVDIAGSLRAIMRNDDLIGRIGGDEFMVCLRNIRENTGFLERRSSYLCQALNKQFGNDVAISGSIGLALFPKDGSTFESLYHKADKALYYAKHHGKNRYVFYNEDLLRGESTTPSAPSLRPLDTEYEAQEAQMRMEAITVRTLLIVDDVEMNREILGEIFQGEYNLLMAENGQQCLQMMERSDTVISAVLLDLYMPGMSGLDVLARVQNDVFMATIPIIVTSAAEELEFSLKAIELGATDFISKPIDPRLVRLRVKNAIQKRETEELRAQNRYLLVQKSDESRHKSELQYLAEHDPLTSICNKASFYHKTRQMLDKSPATSFVMITFDIEKFRVINDIFGHAEGDRLLQYIAQRLHSMYAGIGTYSRIDADNFALCIPYEKDNLRVRIAENERELKSYHLPFDIVLVYGLYIIDDPSLSVSIIYDRAEMAKRTVKGNYVNRYAYYDDEIRQVLLDEQELTNGMNTALEQHQFEVYLQPKCKLLNGEVIGAEALVRWNHPIHGLLQPGKFIPLFERNGFIMKLDAYIWEQVCMLLRKWMDQNGGQPPLPVSMNVSRVNIYNPTLVNILSDLADKHGVPHRFVELEITESAYAQDPKQLSDVIAQLRKLGFVVQMDDFGSAYSSLNMLKEISVDLLKLDMRFLLGSDQDGRGGTILSSIVRMARYLSLPTVAEGVETAEQARFLSSIGCSVGQGYYYYQPMPIPEFEALIAVQPVRELPLVPSLYSLDAVRRVWSVDGDFSILLSTIPCAASLCEYSNHNIELLRINDQYTALTGDTPARIYTLGTSMRNLTTEEEYQRLLTLFSQACDSRQSFESRYLRKCKDDSILPLHLKVHYLTGDSVRSLFFITYSQIDAGGGCA